MFAFLAGSFVLAGFAPEFAPAGAAVVVQETALQIAWISLTLSLAERLESEETTGVWLELEHVCARPRGRD